MSTFALTVSGKSPEAAAEEARPPRDLRLARRLLRRRSDEAAGLADGAVRVGIVHYNTADEVDRLLAELREL